MRVIPDIVKRLSNIYFGGRYANYFESHCRPIGIHRHQRVRGGPFCHQIGNRCCTRPAAQPDSSAVKR